MQRRPALSTTSSPITSWSKLTQPLHSVQQLSLTKHQTLIPHTGSLNLGTQPASTTQHRHQREEQEANADK
ncbi:hypothetical protein E2C01_025009 [Portunus trituberculatus]|uniref:Uncharacterized protein n=1 Tax=Portunus trituberculatus TaxID=210409 RepID=A0A5B7EC33_PORTR|nr:hypothetical protein [Portunus trituberculatus]